MAKFLKEYLLFTLKSTTIILFIFGISIIFVNISSKVKKKTDVSLPTIKNLTTHYNDVRTEMVYNTHPKEEVEKLIKTFKKDTADQNNKTFVIKFDGDIQAKAVDPLKKEVSAILSIANNKDNVVLILESPGGTVSGYGLAASELERLTAKGLKLTVLIDKVAASGGYMMAAVANEIIAAPFAMVGSIGVIHEALNFNELLEKEGIKYEQITSGKYKRTISTFGKNTEEGRKKVQERSDQIHSAFKSLIKSKRPNIDIERVSTGEFWLGTQAKELGLVDNIMTSTDYLTSLYQDNKEVYFVKYEKQIPLLERIMNSISSSTGILNQNNSSSIVPMAK